MIDFSQYKCVVSDPPWTPSLGESWNTRFTDKARPQKHYETMSVADICDMKPQFTKQCHLWLWVINQHVDWGYQVAAAWGFDVWQMLTWCKPGMGTGQFQSNTEHVLVCRCGPRHGNPFGKTGGTWFQWPRGRHSEKPQQFFSLVESASPGPYMEMFARKRRLGWDSWGNEIREQAELFQ